MGGFRAKIGVKISHSVATIEASGFKLGASGLQSHARIGGSGANIGASEA